MTIAHSSQVVLEAPSGGGRARASQVEVEVVSQIATNARSSQVVLEVLVAASDLARASQVALEVPTLPVVPGSVCGTIPVFPTLPVGFPVKWRPTLKTTVQTSLASGREARWPNQQLALHEIELPFEVLRDQTQNDMPYAPLAGYTDFMQLCQFWLMMYGQFGVFYFDAPWDDSRLGQGIGTGDGTTTEFTIYRTFGVSGAELIEPVGGVNVMQHVYLNGVLQSPTSYQTSANLLIFNSAPGGGVAITADFSFYYLCKFLDDEQDFEEFLKNIWMVKALKFRSVYWPLAGLP